MMTAPGYAAPRARNAAVTRGAILRFARLHFARHSYENVGLREISRDAGVDPALVRRYFGNKRQLFKEALRSSGPPVTAGVALEGMAAHLASVVVDGIISSEQQREEKMECLLMMLRSSSSPEAVAVVREAVSEEIVVPLAGLIGAEDAWLRASLTLMVLMGSGILRSAIDTDLLRANNRKLRERLTAIFAVALGAAAERPSPAGEIRPCGLPRDRA